MNLSDILIISSIITGLISIPFLVIGPLSDYIPTGKIVLGLDEANVKGIPSSFSKILTAEKFEKTYETAFGKFRMIISSNEIIQELSKPGSVVTVTENTEETIWKIITQDCMLTINRTADKVVQECTTPDGQLLKIKEMGETTESFNGINLERINEICVETEEVLQEEVEKMEQIKSETVLPEIEEGRVKIVEINVDAEWVKIVNEGNSGINMTNWDLHNGKESGTGTYTYTFGDFILNPNGLLYVYSDDAGNTTNCNITQTSLCWDKSNIWDSSRDIVVLRDASGNEIDRCVYIKTDVQANSIVECE